MPKTTTYTDDGVIVFGAGAAELLDDTFDFAIEAVHASTREVARFRFTAYRDPGPKAALDYARRGATPEAGAIAAAQMIATALLDSDGLPDAYEPAPGEDPDERLEDRDRWSSERRFNWLVEPACEWRMRGEILGELAEHLFKQAATRGGPVRGDADVPPAAPARSSRGRSSTRSGSTAKPRKRA
jgi:hypothetical protein